MIHVIAEIVTKPGQRDTVLAEFRKIVNDVRAEPGCLEYGAAIEMKEAIPVQPPARDNVVYVVEKWESLAALQADLKAAPLQSFLDRAGSLIEQIIARVLEPA